MDDQTHNKLLANLSVAKVQEKKSAISQLSGASSWVSNDADFKQWMSLGDRIINPDDLASTLSGLTLHSRADNHPSHNDRSIWLSGPEGRGKSKAAISIIDILEEVEEKNARSGSDSNIVVAYFFAAPTTDLSTAENVLKSVLWQLISKRRSLAQYAKDLAHTDRSKKKGTGGSSDAAFTVQAMWKVLMDMLRDPGIDGAYFIMNSLHELPEDAESTKQLFQAIEYDVIGTQDPTSPAYDSGEGHRAPTRWLFTSRRRDNINTLLGNKTGVQSMNLDDAKYGGVLRNDLIQHARGKVADLAKKKGYSPALRYLASSLVERRAEDTVWVDVVCRQLELIPANTVEVRKTLTQAPQNLTMLLDRTWSNVLDEKNEDVEWTKELLRALMLAFEDPTVEELGVLAEVTHYGKVSDNKSKLVEAINRCGALIKIIDYDEEELEEGAEEEEWDDDEVAECRVTFLHDSARTRLQERAKELLGLGEEDLKMQHGAMALRSFSTVLKALTPPKEFYDADDDDDDDEGDDDGAPTAGEGDTQERVTNEVVVEEPEEALDYCLEYWLRHAQQATVDVVDNLNIDQAFWALTSDVRTKWWTEYTRIDDDYEELSDMTALHVAAFFGFTPLVERLLKSEESAGHQDEIRQRDSWDNQPVSGTSSFSKSGNDEYHTDCSIQLHWAAEKGHLDVIQLLLDHGADINNGREDHVWTPLMMAASNGELKTMTMLLERHSSPADVNAYASDDGTALTLAIARGQKDAVAHLINYRADPNLTGPDLEPPLALATSMGNGELVKMVMDAGGYKNTESPTYGCALAAAASSSNLEIVQTIFQVDRSLPSRQSALEQAAETASKEIVDYLLRTGPGLQCDAPFEKAAAKGANDILNMLWQYSRGAISQKSKDDSLYTATDFELKKTVELLLAMHANPNAEGEEYGNAL
jgi:ankyrin repeat protein